jgi:hypothetical protein
MRRSVTPRAGTLAAGSLVVTISVNSITPIQQLATLGAGGVFSAVFANVLPASATPYAVSYS